MNNALNNGKQAASQNEVPIGAVVVNPNAEIIGNGYNQVEQNKCQTEHAEMIAIRNATATQNDWRLDNCWLYVTLEPCSMCMGLIKLSRIAGVVYGAPSPLYGYRLDKDDHFRVYKNDTPLIISGIKQNEASGLLKDFFRKKRLHGG